MTYNSDFIEKHRALLSESERIVLAARQKLKNTHIETDWDPELRRKGEALARSVMVPREHGGVCVPDGRHEGRCLFVTGDAGTGKTASLERLFRTLPVLQPQGERRSPLLRVVVPAPCTLKSLGREVLKALGYPLARELAEHIIWARIQELLPVAGVLIIHFDETHNLTDNANVVQMDNIRKTFKMLMVSSWPVGLIISGLPSLIPEMRKIDEIRRRGQFVSVPLLTMPDDNEMVAGIVGGLAEVVGLTIGEEAAGEIAPRLIHASLRRFGIAIELTHEAIELAMLEEKPLSIEHFATAFVDRTGSGALMNPFVASSWAEIDCSLVLTDEPPIEPVLPLDPPRRGSRTRNKGGRS